MQDFQDILNDLAFLAKPRIIAVISELGSLVEVVHSRQAGFSTASCSAPSPLQIVLQERPELLAQLAQRCPAMGATPEQTAQNFQTLRRSSPPMHLEVEDALHEVHQLRSQPFIASLQRSDPFLHATLFGADLFVAELLAGPRLLKLAALVLATCQDGIYFSPPNNSWTWAAPPTKAAPVVTSWIKELLTRAPQLAKDTSTFVREADQVQADAAMYGPTSTALHYYSTEQLKERITACAAVGLFSTAVVAQHTFAHDILRHFDTIIQIPAPGVLV